MDVTFLHPLEYVQVNALAISESAFSGQFCQEQPTKMNSPPKIPLILRETGWRRVHRWESVHTEQSVVACQGSAEELASPTMLKPFQSPSEDKCGILLWR